jgi:hypothetical protein
VASTYEPIASQTLGSAASTVDFTSISALFTDVILVCSYSMTTNTNGNIRVGNGSIDTGNNYSETILYGNGSTAGSTRRSNISSKLLFNANSQGASVQTLSLFYFQSYANGNVYKTILAEESSPSTLGAYRSVGLWRSTSAIDCIRATSTGNFSAGSTFSLYGIKAA